MPDLTNAQAWITLLLGVLLPFLVFAIKWATKKDLSGKLAFAITIGVTGALSVASHYLATFFSSPPAWMGSEMTEIFMLSQVVYQLLKEKLSL